ncbi:MAG TPA: recombinase RecT [Chloroflexota bacterium]|jgi:hypothetical protein
MSTSLALHNQPSNLTNLSVPDLLKLANVLVGTGFLPASIKTAEQAAAVMLKGQELAVPPMLALSNIVIIQGKPTANAELMLALVYRDHGDDAVVFSETNAARCTISYKRRGWRERQSFTFSADDARTAGLSGGNWAKYPGPMLRARCISAVARLAFPDSIGGMYTPDELGAVSQVDGDTGEILSAAESVPSAQHITVAETSVSRTEPPQSAVQVPSHTSRRPSWPGTGSPIRDVVDPDEQEQESDGPEPDGEAELRRAAPIPLPPTPGKNSSQREWLIYLTAHAQRLGITDLPTAQLDDTEDQIADTNRSLAAAIKQARG